MIGDHEKSIQYYERAMQLSPRDLLFEFEFYTGIAAPHFCLGHYDQALHWADRALRIKPRYLPALGWKIAALAMSGSHPDQLRDAAQQLQSTYPSLTIAAYMPRLNLSRSSDRELVITALRKAGIPE
jgi:adenylate cyclase